MADKGCLSQGILGNQLSKTLTIKTPLYISNHFFIPTATTVSGVFKYPGGRSRSDAKKTGPAVRSENRNASAIPGLDVWIAKEHFWTKTLATAIVKAARVARDRVDPVSVDDWAVGFAAGLIGVIGVHKDDEEAVIRMDLGFRRDREGKGLIGEKRWDGGRLLKPWKLGFIEDERGTRTGKRRARGTMAAISDCRW